MRSKARTPGVPTECLADENQGSGVSLTQKNMIVGSLRVRLLIRDSRSLKDKRQVVQSIKDRLRNAWNVSVAEVEAQDHRQMVVLGVAMVGNEVRHVRTSLEEIVNALRSHPVAEFIDSEMEV